VSEVRRWAREYRDRGYAVCRIRPGAKRPTYQCWNQYSLEPDDFRRSDNIGLQAGTLSRNLVCVDLDHPDVLQQADRYLPPTGMVEGRPGKPKSHRWFRVKDVPAELTAPEKVAGGLGGPRTRRLMLPDKTTLIDFLGTGSQAVVPASIWLSKDGARSERREWQKFTDPAIVDCGELFEATCRLAAACGWVERRSTPRAKRKGVSREAPALLPLPSGEAARQARAYLGGVPPAIEGQGGDSQTFAAACVLVLEYGLTPEEALPLFLEYNQRCVPPWTVAELQHKLAMADAQECDNRGWRVWESSRKVTVSLRPEGPVYVGMGCAGPGLSFVELSPSLYAGMVKGGTAWQLAPELAAIAWQGRGVLLAPASTVTTNAREVWGEFFLARLLRKEGADVQSIRLPPLNGRRRTLVMADESGWGVVSPPEHSWQAGLAADKAKEEARRVDASRRALPRDKPSPKLEKAIAFVQKHNVTRLTQDVVKKARKRDISQTTLRRAIDFSKTWKASPLLLFCECISLFELVGMDASFV
jgi:hypothetical protein